MKLYTLRSVYARYFYVNLEQYCSIIHQLLSSWWFILCCKA